MKVFCVYILANGAGVLYVGVTGRLRGRVRDHKQGLVVGFTQRYGVNRLVYFEQFRTADAALRREKQLKRWTRAKKVALVEKANPRWADLAEGWYG